MCQYYNIPIQHGVDSGPVWNSQNDRWEEALINLPTTPFGTLLLVPKIAVRHRLVYDAQNYYRYYLLPSMQIHEKSINSGFVRTLKDRTTKVTKKSLREKYGADKLALAQQILKHPEILEQYRQEAARTSRPITHHQLAEIENIDAPRFDRLLADVTQLPVCRDSATAYENAIEALLSALFFPSLSASIKQSRIHDGRKRIVITYVNSSQTGFSRDFRRTMRLRMFSLNAKTIGKRLAILK